MELNETLTKVDLTLDSTVKKVEKQAKEMQNAELKIEVNNQVKGNEISEIYGQDLKTEKGKAVSIMVLPLRFLNDQNIISLYA